MCMWCCVWSLVACPDNDRLEQEIQKGRLYLSLLYPNVVSGRARVSIVDHLFLTLPKIA
jgi:hypothetical protein